MPKKKKTETQTSSFGELRAVGEEGTFEGYLTVWNSVDSYNSTFTRGAFAETIKGRDTKVKIFYDHEHLIGSSLELREDDHGLFGRGQLNLKVDKAIEAHEFMKDGTLDGLSFRFRPIKEDFKNGVRQINKVELLEFGPVIFPSNPQADITSVRAEDFETTLNQKSLEEEGWTLRSSLATTLSDIWWSENTTSENIVAKVDKALSDHHAAYIDFTNRWVSAFWTGTQSRSSPFDNTLANKFSEHLFNQRKSTLDIASETAFTLNEVNELRQGNLIADREKLKSLPDSVTAAHKEIRNQKIEQLCTELRQGLSESESLRIKTLLQVREEQPVDTEFQATIDYFKNQQLIGETE